MEPGKTLFKGFVVQADRGFKRGVAPALVLVERADAIHVGFHISTWRKDQADTSTSTIIIQITARDRDLRLQGNVVEPRFPMIDIFAGAGWSHGQQQFIVVPSLTRSRVFSTRTWSIIAPRSKNRFKLKSIRKTRLSYPLSARNSIPLSGKS